MQTFTKAERLHSKVAIDKLFEKGKAFNSFPFKVIWLEAQNSSVPAQIVIAVPKRIFKKAVDRNKIKRLIREAYRKNKKILYYNLNESKIFFMLLYTSKTIMEYKEIEDKTILALKRLSQEVNSNY